MGYKIAIDGPSGAGKGYLAKALSKRLNIIYIDTGAMYRAFGLFVIRHNINLENNEETIKALTNCNIEFKDIEEKLHVYLNKEDVTDKIRTEAAGMMASKVSTVTLVRFDMVKRQREMGSKLDVVMEGRDIGSVVFKDADVKIYLDATIEIRAKRRLLELQAKGMDVTLEKTKEEMQKRDEADINKPISPLVRAEDAIYVDASNMTREEMVDHVLGIIKKKGVVV